MQIISNPHMRRHIALLTFSALRIPHPHRVNIANACIIHRSPQGANIYRFHGDHTFVGEHGEGGSRIGIHE